MSTDPKSESVAYPSTDAEGVVQSALDLKRDELTARLRSARAALSPKAAVAATAQSGDVSEAAELAASVARQLPAAAPAGFQPRSMTMKLILERPDITLRLVIALATLFFGARAAARFGSAAALVRTFRQTLDGIKGGATPPST